MKFDHRRKSDGILFTSGSPPLAAWHLIIQECVRACVAIGRDERTYVFL